MATSEHRPAARLEGDVFPPGDGPVTPLEVARLFWADVRNWTERRYLPVITVVMEDGTEHDVDLEMHGAGEES